MTMEEEKIKKLLNRSDSALKQIVNNSLVPTKISRNRGTTDATFPVMAISKKYIYSEHLMKN